MKDVATPEGDSWMPLDLKPGFCAHLLQVQEKLHAEQLLEGLARHELGDTAPTGAEDPGRPVGSVAPDTGIKGLQKAFPFEEPKQPVARRG